jgi:ubiquinone biosynthesis protein COQ9
MSEAVEERRALKDKLLESALLHAAFDGWSRRTLLNAAKDAGVDPATARRLFPRGGDSLLEWLDDWADRQMLAATEGEDLSQLPVRRRIARLARARLEALGQHREALRRAAVAHLLPGNLLGSGRSLWQTVDRMWQAAGLGGDPAEGFGYYSRRATLAGVLTATFLYWLQDQSDGFADSWAFLDRRIDDVMRFGQASSRFTSMFGRGRGPASAT